MVVVVADEIGVCVPCAMVIANAEAFEDHEDVSERIAEAQVAIWGDDAIGLVLTDIGREYHSKYPCEGCGDPDEGTRLYAAVLR